MMFNSRVSIFESDTYIIDCPIQVFFQMINSVETEIDSKLKYRLPFVQGQKISFISDNMNLMGLLPSNVSDNFRLTSIGTKIHKILM